MKSWAPKHEGSIDRSEPPMIGDDMHINNSIAKRDDDSQGEENNINFPGYSPNLNSNSVLDGNGEKDDEQKSIADLRTFYYNSSLIGGRERSLSDPIEINDGNFQSISISSAASNSVRILPEFLVEHARSMSFSATESIHASLSNILSAGPHSERDSMHHNSQSSATPGNSSLPANSDLIYNSVLSSQYHSTSAQAPGMNNLPSFNKISWRKGKWIDEEGVYTKKLIEAFNAGLLKIPSGTTLRSFLAEQLSCDPMRITKKFARSSAIGKQVFVPCDLSKTDPKVLKEVQDELNGLGEKFRAKVELAQSSSIFPINTHAALAAAMRGVQGRSAPPYFEGLPSEVLRNLVLAQQNQLIRNSLIHTGQISPNADSSLQLSSHGLPDMTTLSSLYFGTTSRSAKNGASSSGTSSSTSALQEDDRIKPELSSGCASTTEGSETVLGKIDESANAIRNDNVDPQSTIGNILGGDSAAKFLKRLSDHHSESTSQFIKPAAIPPTVAVPSSSKLERKPSSTTLNSNTVSLANISKSLYEAQLNESQSQAMNYNQTFGTGLINMANFPYDLLYNQSAKYSTVSATEGKKLRKERVGGNPSEVAKAKIPSGSKRQPQLQPQVHTRKSDNDKSSNSSSHTQQQQQQLLSKLQQEIFNNATKKSSVGDDKAKSKSSAASKKYTREQSSSSSSSSMHESVGNKDQQAAREEELNQQLPQHSGDLYASDLLMNFFKAANHSPMSGVQQVFSDSNQFHGENGDGDDYVNGQHMRRDNPSSDLPMKNGMEKLPSNNNNNNSASNGTCSDSGESNGNGHGAHKVNSKSHTTSESDSSTSTSGNEEHDQDRERKSSSSPSSMADEAPRATAKDRSATNTDRSKGKLTAVTVSTGDLQETGSDHKSSDLTNNSHSISDEESTDSSTRFEIDASNSNSSNDLKSNHFDGNRLDAEGSGVANEDSSGDITGSGSSNPTTTNNNTSSNSKKRSRTTFQRSEVEEDMLRVESDVYCTLDTLQSQGETIDSNARKKLVNRIHSSPTKLLEAKSKSAYDNGPSSSVE